MTARTISLKEKLDCLKREIQKLRGDITHGSKKPHKLIILLAVSDLFGRRIIVENKTYFNDELIESF